MSPQNKAILAYINEHGGITNGEAYNELFVGNLKGRIHEIRKDEGYSIPVEKIKNETNSGHHVRYMFSALDAERYNNMTQGVRVKVRKVHA